LDPQIRLLPLPNFGVNRVIIDFIYFYAPTVTRKNPSNSFMDGPAIDSILPILSIYQPTLSIKVRNTP
jgi:hypothetical protein